VCKKCGSNDYIEVMQTCSNKIECTGCGAELGRVLYEPIYKWDKNAWSWLETEDDCDGKTH